MRGAALCAWERRIWWQPEGGERRGSEDGRCGDRRWEGRTFIVEERVSGGATGGVEAVLERGCARERGAGVQRSGRERGGGCKTRRGGGGAMEGRCTR